MRMHHRHENLVWKGTRSTANHSDNGPSDEPRPDQTFWLPIEIGLPGKAKKNGSETDSADVIRGKPGNAAYRKTRLDQFALPAGAAIEDDRVS